MDDIEKFEARADVALQQRGSQADMEAFERLLMRMDDAELRGLGMAMELYMMQRLANAQSKPDPIAP